MVAVEPLTEDERDAIVVAVKSAFTRLRNLYKRIEPIFIEYGFTPPSPGVLARDPSERIEKSIVQHCDSFSRGQKHCDLARHGQDWEVKIAKGSGLTINQSKQIAGETYIVANYTADIVVTKIWVLWGAADSLFSPRKPNTNARALTLGKAQDQIQVLYETGATNVINRLNAKPAKAHLSPRSKRAHTA